MNLTILRARHHNQRAPSTWPILSAPLAKQLRHRFIISQSPPYFSSSPSRGATLMRRILPLCRWACSFALRWKIGDHQSFRDVALT